MNKPTIERRGMGAIWRARLRRTILVPAALALALMASGCDKCGDYFWTGGAKSCHDDSQVK